MKILRLEAEDPAVVRARDLGRMASEPVGGDGLAKFPSTTDGPSVNEDEDDALFAVLDAPGYMVGENNEANAGMVAHRGILDEREFELLDWAEVRGIVLAKLGVDHESFEAAYGDQPGRPSAGTLDIRRHVDERLLAISEAGGNMTQLANILLWDVDPEHGCRKMRRVLERAKEAREAS